MARRPDTGPHPLPVAAGDWRIVPAQSELGFLTRIMLGLVKVRGRYSGFSGELHIDASGNANGALQVESETISTGIKQRDRHLRSKDFFHVEAHPHMRFELTGLSAGSDGSARLTGTLHIRDHAIPIDTPVSIAATSADAARIEADFVVDHRAAGFEFKPLPPAVRVQAALTLERTG